MSFLSDIGDTLEFEWNGLKAGLETSFKEPFTLLTDPRKVIHDAMDNQPSQLDYIDVDAFSKAELAMEIDFNKAQKIKGLSDKAILAEETSWYRQKLPQLGYTDLDNFAQGLKNAKGNWKVYRQQNPQMVSNLEKKYGQNLSLPPGITGFPQIYLSYLFNMYNAFERGAVVKNTVVDRELDQSILFGGLEGVHDIGKGVIEDAAVTAANTSLDLAKILSNALGKLWPDGFMYIAVGFGVYMIISKLLNKII